jgi:glutamine synthetase
MYYSKNSSGKNNDKLKNFPSLPSSCVESSEILLKKRDLYERNGVIPPIIIEYTANLLKEENDSGLAHKLASLSGNDGLREIRRVMHRDLHRH